MKLIDDNIWGCVDCLMIITNDDASGMDDETEGRVRAGIAAMSKHGWIALHNQDDDKEFSWRACDICGSCLGGSRHHFALFGNSTTEAK